MLRAVDNRRGELRNKLAVAPRIARLSVAERPAAAAERAKALAAVTLARPCAVAARVNIARPAAPRASHASGVQLETARKAQIRLTPHKNLRTASPSIGGV